MPRCFSVLLKCNYLFIANLYLNAKKAALLSKTGVSLARIHLRMQKKYLVTNKYLEN